MGEGRRTLCTPPTPQNTRRGSGRANMQTQEVRAPLNSVMLLENIRQATVRLVLCLTFSTFILKYKMWVPGLPGGSVIKNPPANAGDTGSIPDLGRSHMPQSS